MRIIKFKPSGTSEFENYIDIGSCDRDYYFINFYLPGEHENRSRKLYFDSYNSWFENFKVESIGSKMIIINYYLSEYMGWNSNENTPQIDYFADVYGDKTASIISSNLDYFLQFHDNWFFNQSSLFKGLDLNWDDIEERFVRTKETEDGIMTEIELDDGSIISFLDEDTKIRSFYVPEEDYLILKNELEKSVSKFQP